MSGRSAGFTASALRAAIEDAISIVRSARRISAKRVHDARKAIKTARALLRLTRCGIDPAAYELENGALRDAGRLLSPLRDTRSLADALTLLSERHPRHLVPTAVETMRAVLRTKAVRARREFARNRGRDRYLQILLGCKRRVAHLGRSGGDAKTIAQSLARIYRAGRRAMPAARADPTSEALHEWRKQVKYLIGALERIQAAQASGLKGTIRRLRRLGEWLGDDHDLAMLAIECAAISPAILADERAANVAALIRKRRTALQVRSFELAREVYRSTPSRFVRKIGLAEDGKRRERASVAFRKLPRRRNSP